MTSYTHIASTKATDNSVYRLLSIDAAMYNVIVKASGEKWQSGRTAERVSA